MSGRSTSTSIFFSGLLAGAAAAWFMDPQSGRRRRTLLKDAAVHTGHVIKKNADKTSRDLRNRARGRLAAGRSFFQQDQATDAVIEQRVRSQLGRLVSHSDAIQVRCNNGEVTLSGHLLAAEADRLLSRVRSVRGVRAVDSRLHLHQEPGDNPDLQPRNGHANGTNNNFLQNHWSPATRFAAGAAGIALAGLGRNNRILGPALRSGGTALLTRAIGRRGYRKALGLDRNDRGIEVQKTTHINAPVEQVYNFWSRPENFARIMSHVKEVRNSSGSYRWTVSGPGGISVSWNSTVTKNVPNRLIEWESDPGSPIRNCGCVRFDEENGGTRVHVRMYYNPVGGILSHSLATLLGAGPKRALDEDMVRIKSLFELGKTTAHHHAVHREELMTA